MLHSQTCIFYKYFKEEPERFNSKYCQIRVRWKKINMAIENDELADIWI